MIAAEPRPTSRKAAVALGLAILGALTGFYLLPLLGSLIAIFLGFSARRDIRDHPQRKGKRKATAAVIIGILGLLGWALIILAVLAAGPPTGAGGAFL
jgi:Domain of unknown function (DUF4190)